MSSRIIRKLKAAALILASFAGFHVFAADPVTDAMQEAYAPYRIALFKTNGNSQPESQQALLQAQQSWGILTARFGAKPPAPYDLDTAFAASLAEVSLVYAKASEQVAANQLPVAHETLEKVRDIVADMRHRSQVAIYSDHMNAYHAEMEHVLIDGGKILTQPNGMQQLTAAAGALSYLANRLTTEAPASYLKNPEFISLLKGVDKSVSDLQAALLSSDAAAIKEAMGKVKSPYGKFFLKFG